MCGWSAFSLLTGRICGDSGEIVCGCFRALCCPSVALCAVDLSIGNEEVGAACALPLLALSGSRLACEPDVRRGCFPAKERRRVGVGATGLTSVWLIAPTAIEEGDVTGFFVLARLRRVLLLAGLALAVLPAGSALADTTIGQTGGAGVFCFALYPFGDTNYVVPAGGGTITSFSFQSATINSGEQLDFLALRPAGGLNYTVVGKTGVVTLTGLGLETFPASIPVRAGDILGFWTAGGLYNCARVAAGGGFIGGTSQTITDPGIGDTIAFQGSLPVDLNESANLVTLPTSKDQCKNGGWPNYVDSNGTRFKNQGDCVSFVATGGKNPASGT